MGADSSAARLRRFPEAVSGINRVSARPDDRPRVAVDYEMDKRAA